MAETAIRSATWDGAATIRCAECGAQVPAERGRFREERVKVARAATTWRSAGNRAVQAPAHPYRGKARYAYEVERVPICLNCLRRQRASVVGLCGFAVLCVGAALFVYSGDETPPAAVAVSAPPALSPIAASPGAGSIASVPSAQPAAKPITLPSPSRSTVPSPATGEASSPPDATTNAPVTASAALPIWEADQPPPIWQQEEHKSLPRKAAPVARHPAPPPRGIQALRASGYAALQNRSYAAAYWQLQQATMMGDAYAPMYIGQMFEYGLGVSRDPGQASYWYGIAVNRGNAAALAAFHRLRANPY